ncbi:MULTISPECIES: DUF1990 family protein [Actinomadura]|uniref:DUF1990 family protein n=1 Tax=Actinomadura litoris TaxID=2678616 RepID=A0A7K1L6P8_9ACTN|nr:MULTISPECIES: DUF1990 domain-containing protein [Actinomadura]MBT2209388.1 DUF1990 family protein [Actinomadura sp. NEAU-AAG7]MUN40080.1 DUF1990 family protein [Actinomadura litoris]
MTAQDFTYAEVGATWDADRPDGYRHMRVRTLVGEGPAVMRNATDALMEFWMHRALPARVRASAPRVAPGVSVEVGLGAGPLRLRAPCRVVWTREEEHRAGWAYGTLPGHPAAGEEAFVVHRDESGEVWLTVTAFSRPAGAAGRLAGPLMPVFQRAYARRCGAVLRRLARA